MCVCERERERERERIFIYLIMNNELTDILSAFNGQSLGRCIAVLTDILNSVVISLETRFGRNALGRTKLHRRQQEENVPQLERCIMTK